MKKTLTTSKIIAAVRVLSDKDTKLGKMKDADRFAVVRTLRSAKPIAEAYNKYLEDARERLKPEDFGKMQEKVQKYDALPDEEKFALDKAFSDYTDAVNRCVADELAVEREVEVVPLSNDGFSKFMSSNESMSAGAFAAVLELMEK